MITRLLTGLVFVLIASTGCSRAITIETNPSGAKVYRRTWWYRDGQECGRGMSLEGTSPLTLSADASESEFAATDGKRIIWQYEPWSREDKTIRLDLARYGSPLSELEAAVFENKIALGMTQEQVRRAWGSPHRTSRSLGRMSLEIWTWDYSISAYSGGTLPSRPGLTAIQTVSFADGVVVSADQYGD